MSMVKKSISVTGQQEAWIQAQIKAGHYGNDSEFGREALREKQLRTAEPEAIRSQMKAQSKACADGDHAGKTCEFRAV